MDFTTLAFSFLMGALFAMFLNYLINTGYAVIMMKRAISDCLLFMAKSLQEVYEIKYLKEEALKIAGRDDKYIEWQKRIDEKEIQSIKRTCIRNFINSIPPRYNHLIKFHDWNTAMNYIDKIIKEEK